MTRTLVLLRSDEYGTLETVTVQAALALARCPRCKSRFRVLPADVAPPIDVPPLRYRSPGRRERLVCGRVFLGLAGCVAETGPPHALSAWQRQLLGFSALFVISFRTGLSCTSPQHPRTILLARCRPRSRETEEPP